MGSKAPPIPPEQRAFGGRRADLSSDHTDRRDLRTGSQSGQPGDSDVNMKQQGRHGNIAQNLHHQQGR